MREVPSYNVKRFKMGTKVKILPIDMFGIVLNVRKDKFGQPLYDLEREDGELHVARGQELSASLEATHESTRIQSKQ